MTIQEFNRSVDEWADKLYRFVIKHVGREDKAQDIIQDTFEKVWRKVDEIPYKKARFYLFRTAYNTMVDGFRKEKFEADMEVVKNDPSSSGGQYSDLSEILNEGLKKLPQVQRSVILLRDHEGYSYDEIGEVVGLNASQVKVYIYRARKALKKYIGSIETVI